MRHRECRGSVVPSARVRALRHPALGLVLVVLGLTGLPQQMFGLVTLITGGDGLPVELLAMFLAQLAVGVLQVGTGWAIIRGRAPTAWFSAYVAACIALTALTALLMRGEDVEPKLLLGIALETLGLPALIIIASAIYPSEAFDDERAPADVVAMLLVIAVRTLTMTPLDLVQNIRLLDLGTTTPGEWAGTLLWPTISLGLGVLALVAAWRFARRSLRIYVVAAIGVHVAMVVLSIVWTLVESDDGSGGSFRTQVIAHQILGLVSIIGPLTLWWYARERLASPELTAPRAPSRVPIWLALSYVPTLLARAFLADEMTALWGGRSTALIIAITGTVAVILLAAADSAFRQRTSARWWTLASAAGGVALVAGAAVVVLGADNRFRALGLLGPLGNLVASTTVAAWLYRALPRV
jgi:hypothetical protein